MGLGGNTDEKALEAWASKPEYYQKAGFTGLDEKVNDVLNTMCQGMKSFWEISNSSSGEIFGYSILPLEYLEYEWDFFNGI